MFYGQKRSWLKLTENFGDSDTIRVNNHFGLFLISDFRYKFNF